MDFNHEFFVGLAKSLGLIWMMAIFFGAVLYAYWPSNKSKFDHAANSVLENDLDEKI